MTKPRVWYIVEFPRGYVVQSYFYKLGAANRWLKAVKEKYAIEGTVTKVKKCQ